MMNNTMLSHICLVSNNLLANLIPVLMDCPHRVHLVVTDEMQAECQRFQKLLEMRQIPYTVHNSAPSTGMVGLREYAENLACKLDKEYPVDSIVLNATGGTKLMALAFVETFRGLLSQVEVIYTDTEHGCLESLTDRHQPSRPMASVLDIPTYLAAHGLTRRSSASDDKEWLARAERRKALSKRLAQEAGTIGKFLGVLNKLANESLNVQGKFLVHPVQTFGSLPQGRWRETLEFIRPYDLIDWQGQAEIIFCSADAARYLGGLWLEEYAWHVIRDEQPDEVQVGVVGTWEGNRRTPLRNEFDLLAVHGNRMLVVECKTQRFGNDTSKDQDILHKLESLGRNAGGLFGSTLLLSARPLSPSARDRAVNYGITVIEADREAGKSLINLRGWIQRWMQAHA